MDNFLENVQVFIAATEELSKNAGEFDITIEAEFGEYVKTGVITAAHHVESYKHLPPVCVQNFSFQMKNLRGEIKALISHLDLDTIGALERVFRSRKRTKKEKLFWKGVAYIDIKGRHKIHDLPKSVQKQIIAYWAASNALLPRILPEQEEQVSDVTDIILEHLNMIDRILNDEQELLDLGKNWLDEVNLKVENCLIAENEYFRVFETSNVVTSSGYYSKKYNKDIDITISLNTKKEKLTLATIHPEFNCKKVMQKLWGTGAGGHQSISGSPKGMQMQHKELIELIEAVIEELDILYPTKENKNLNEKIAFMIT